MVQHITALNSNFTTTSDAFAGTGPDTLIVDTDAYLITTLNSGKGANLTGSWTVTINGSSSVVILRSGLENLAEPGRLNEFLVDLNSKIQPGSLCEVPEILGFCLCFTRVYRALSIICGHCSTTR